MEILPSLPPLRSPSLFLMPSPTSPSLSPLSLSLIKACCRPLAICLLEEASSDNSYANNISAPTTKVLSFPCPSSPFLSLPSSSPTTVALPCVVDSFSPSLPTPSIDVSSPPSPALPLSSLPSPATIALPCVAHSVSPSLPTPQRRRLLPSLSSPPSLFPPLCQPPLALPRVTDLLPSAFWRKLLIKACCRPSVSSSFLPGSSPSCCTDHLFLSSSWQPAAV